MKLKKPTWFTKAFYGPYLTRLGAYLDNLGRTWAGEGLTAGTESVEEEPVGIESAVAEVEAAPAVVDDMALASEAVPPGEEPLLAILPDPEPLLEPASVSEPEPTPEPLAEEPEQIVETPPHAEDEARPAPEPAVPTHAMLAPFEFAVVVEPEAEPLVDEPVSEPEPALIPELEPIEVSLPEPEPVQELESAEPPARAVSLPTPAHPVFPKAKVSGTGCRHGGIQFMARQADGAKLQIDLSAAEMALVLDAEGLRQKVRDQAGVELDFDVYFQKDGVGYETIIGPLGIPTPKPEDWPSAQRGQR